MIHCFLQNGNKQALAYIPLDTGQKPVAAGRLYATISREELEQKVRSAHPQPCRSVNIAPYVYRSPSGMCKFCTACHCTLTPTERSDAASVYCLTHVRQPIADYDSSAHFLLPHGKYHYMYEAHIKHFLTVCPRLWNVPCVGYVWYAADYHSHVNFKNACWQYGARNTRLCQRRWILSEVFWPLRIDPEGIVSSITTKFSAEDQAWVTEIVLCFLEGCTPHDLKPISVVRRKRKLEQEAVLSSGKGVTYQISNDLTLTRQPCSHI